MSGLALAIDERLPQSEALPVFARLTVAIVSRSRPLWAEALAEVSKLPRLPAAPPYDNEKSHRFPRWVGEFPR
jgi:hypothetical protein